MTAKQEVREILERLPDDASLEDIQYHIYVRSKIEKGLTDLANDRVIDQADIEKRTEQWTDA